MNHGNVVERPWIKGNALLLVWSHVFAIAAVVADASDESLQRHEGNALGSSRATWANALKNGYVANEVQLVSVDLEHVLQEVVVDELQEARARAVALKVPDVRGFGETEEAPFPLLEQDLQVRLDVRGHGSQVLPRRSEKYRNLALAALVVASWVQVQAHREVRVGHDEAGGGQHALGRPGEVVEKVDLPLVGASTEFDFFQARSLLHAHPPTAS